ncbi:hypothetical protein DNTS_000327 [Danionella cerebrum]|nr:hypothetical protein DNTS_000327 [Danionella translucida]TRY97524.1 hypothetical protein DNTS_000327 [Danionella translucida]
MTTRLLSRWVHWLPHYPRVATASVRLKSSITYIAPLSAPRSCIHPFVRHFCSPNNLVNKEEPSATDESSKSFSELLSNATTLAEVFQIWNDHGALTNDAAKCLLTLQTFPLIGGILVYPGYMNMFDTLQRDVESLSDENLVRLPQALSNINLPFHGPLQSTIQQELVLRIRKLSYSQLSFLLQWVDAQRSIGLENEQLTTTLLKLLELRWVELTDTQSLLILFKRASLFTPSFREKLDDKVLELAERFSAWDSQKVASILILQNRRALSLLKAITYYLNLKEISELPIKLLLDIVYAYARLNFTPVPFLNKIASELLGKLEKMDPLDVCRLAKSMSILQYVNKPLFSGIAQVHKALKDSFQNFNPITRLHLVWSLCILKQATSHHISSVTTQEFVNELFELTGQVCKSEFYHLKLLNVIAYDKLELAEIVREPIPTILVPEYENGEILVDSKLKFLDLEEFQAPHLPGGGGQKTLPNGTRRIAFLALDYSAFCLNTNELLGMFLMQKRHLQHAGFIVVEVPHFEFMLLKGSRQKVAYLQDKVKKAVAENVAK